MQLKFKETISKPEGFMTAAVSLQWSPDSKKLSALRFDRNMMFFNENCQRWDQIQTRGVDHTKPARDYVPCCHSYASDSQYIAVGQTDQVVYVFNVGKQLEKKAIQGRFQLQAPATSICWMNNGDNPLSSDILVGCGDGSAYLCSMARKQTQNLFSYQCFAQLMQVKQINPDGQQSTQPGSPIVAIHKINNNQAVFVAENGLSALFDLQAPVLRVVSRHQCSITASAILTPRNQQNKQFLIICDSAMKVVVNSVETGQALAQVQMRTQSLVTAAVANPAGNGIILASQAGLQYISLSSLSPLVIQHDVSSSLDFNAETGSVATITSMAWRPDAAIVVVSYSNGQIDALEPSLSSCIYQGVEVTSTAPNRSQLRLKNFSSRIQNSPAGILEMYLENSSEIQKVQAYPKSVFAECARNGEYNKSVYVCAIGEHSFSVYSFETDLLTELSMQVRQNDRLYFDVGVKRVLVLANIQLGEFTVAMLPNTKDQKAVVYSTVRNCSYASNALISCSPLDGSKIIAAHVGEDRQEFVVTELSPPDDADDFTEPLTVLSKQKHTRIIDWIDISPSGRNVLLRDVSGAIMVFIIAQQQLIDVSPSLGNGAVFWAAPFDVLVAQEAPDMPILVYYNVGDAEDKPQLLNVPADAQGWVLKAVEQTSGQKGAMQAIVQRHDGQKQLSLSLDQDLLLFNMMMQTKEVGGACILLTKSSCTNRNQWLRLCQLALDQRQFMVCSRCYAALGDLGLSRYARQIHSSLKQKRQQFESDFQFQTYCDAQVAVLKGDLDVYDRLLVQCNYVREAIDMYRELRLYHRAEQIAPEAEKQQLHNEGIDWLVQTKQSTLAAQLKAQRGDYRGALELLMNDKAYLAAYELVVKIKLAQPDALSSHAVEALATNLETFKHYLQAGNLIRQQDPIRALSLYRKGQQYQEAIALARTSQPNECVFIEKEWAQYLYQTGHYSEAIAHFIEARESRKAVDCALKAGNYDAAERLLLETNVENQLELCLRLAEARYLQGDVDSAVEWFKRSDQSLLAVASLTSVGRFDEAIKCIARCFPPSNAPDVVVQEAKRLIRIEERKPAPITSGSISPSTIIAKMESMSSVHGVLAAKDLLSAAGMYDHALELLEQHKMFDELVAFAKDHRTASYVDILERAAESKRSKGDVRGCAQLYSELASELYKQSQEKDVQSLLNRALETSTQLFASLNMFEDAMAVARRCGSPEYIVIVALQQIQVQPTQLTQVAQSLAKLRSLEAAIARAVQNKQFETAMLLAEHATSPEETKKDVWARHGKVLELEGKLQEAEHAYMTAGKAVEALSMYVDAMRWADAEKVANNMPMGDAKEKAIKSIKEGRARVLINEGKLKEAESLFVEMNMLEDMIQIYTEKQMWAEANRLTKEHDRRDLTLQVQYKLEEFERNRGQAKAAQPTTLSRQLAEKDMANRKNQQIAALATATGLRGQLINACSAGGDKYLEMVLKRASEIASMVLNDQITENSMSEDMGILSSIIQGLDQMELKERAVNVAVAYLVKGIPASMLGGPESKATISPIISVGANREQLQAVARAVLSLEFNEDDFAKRLQTEVAKDGLCSKMRQILIAFRANLVAAKGQGIVNQNKAFAIPGDEQLSRCFEALHLVVQSSLTQQNTPQQQKERCQVLSALVRYSDLIPIDRCLTLAGQACRKFFTLLLQESSAQATAMRKQYGGQAFVFLNRLMDVMDLKPGQNTLELDNIDIKGSGIPLECKISAVKFPSAKTIEEIRAFIMQVSVNADAEQNLPLENCPHGCGSERWIGALACPKCKNSSPLCCITGQHVINHQMKSLPAPACQSCGCYARPAPWNTFVAKTKSCAVCGELGNPIGK